MVYRHLEGAKSRVRVLFVDFSSAFNTIQPYILAQRLSRDFSLDRGLVLWLLDILSRRSQRVKIGPHVSDIRNTRLSSGMCFVPLYTNSCTSSHPDRHLVKFADDTALISLLHDDKEHHGPVLDDFVEWCEEHHGPVLDDFVEWCEEHHGPVLDDFVEWCEEHHGPVLDDFVEWCEEHHGPVLDDFVEWCEEHHGPVLDDFVEWCEEHHGPGPR
ncbi:uncharacterized protein LOC127916197 [Oncorhynchus keta]|uniref:uncharacterized protein LOC127916197 n=1 Tax=Oncorhynchus keta TaxID=8018 RepID=UPI00227BE4B8|nr:uncharacterized protein LOC127916197 [Oncorhynchus keta]